MSTQNLAELPDRLPTLLDVEDSDAGLAACLEAIATSFEAVTATLHRMDSDGAFLLLAARRGLPEQVLPMTQKIPVGKGMAGLCAERREPVTVCNIQTDDSGTARAGARQTGAGGGIVVPVLADDGAVAGTLGVGKAGEHDYTDLETEVLQKCAAGLRQALTSN